MQPVTCKKRIKRASCGKAPLLLLKPEKAANRDSITSKAFGGEGRRDLSPERSLLPSPTLFSPYNAFTSPTTEMIMSRARTTLRKRASSTVENQRLPNHMPPNMGTMKTRVKMMVSRLMSPCCQ